MHLGIPRNVIYGKAKISLVLYALRESPEMLFLVKIFFKLYNSKICFVGPWLNLGSWVLYGWNLLVGYYIPFSFAEIWQFGHIFLPCLEYVLHLKIKQHLCSTVHYRIVHYIMEVKASLYGAIHATSDKS